MKGGIPEYEIKRLIFFYQRRIQSLRVADLHSLLRALGCSYQANKDILVKRVISKYADLYDQYREGIIGSQTVKMHTEILNRHAPLPPKPQSYATTSHSNFPTSKNNVKPPVSLDSKKDIARVTTPAQNVITMSIDSGNIAIPKRYEQVCCWCAYAGLVSTPSWKVILHWSG